MVISHFPQKEVGKRSGFLLPSLTKEGLIDSPRDWITKATPVLSPSRELVRFPRHHV
ncbi:hypothetical protein BABINDRAFT_163646 [Babjeviella inositovora NRRL Y-12698]|uniref:Uncharacterized protein n=1 Tax=Babjeviella inositovora NRRL Y-12698 TaxID=984486 RepID=A0A1E3QID3_9ASCO|nr:uncharacterized protein BABINDRAFT_163646 [Babjeviella inositovora NRRL Y-12698]ODQ77400.1 hypothetical protein BABINDRAFT_163646 [Babjeviella inositovora NRRL Y-12698]